MSALEELLANLEEDGITIDKDTIKMATIGDVHSMIRIGYEYDSRKQNYEKAMAWFRLASLQNNSYAQFNIGSLYFNGEGIPKDDLIALEWYLKAAKQNNKGARDAVGISFEEGRGVEVNTYKALEWYYKSGKSHYKIKAMEEQGIRLDDQGKDKPFVQLVMETDEIIQQTRKRKEDDLKEEIHSLKELNTRMEEDLKNKMDTIKHLEDVIRPIRQYTTENEKLGEELHFLKEAYYAQSAELEEKHARLKALNIEIISLCKTYETQLENTNKRLEDVEKSNHNLRVLMEQEKRIKENEIRLANLEVKASLKDGNMLKRKLEDAYRDIKKEIKHMKRASERHSATEKITAKSVMIYNLEDGTTEVNDGSDEQIKTEII